MSHPSAGLLAPPESVAPRGRSLAPDLARGFMLLAIALAHIPAFITNMDLGPAPLNATADFLRVLLLDNQARIMFIFLFGYGLGQLLHRRAAQGAEWTDVRGLLRRRGVWLFAIGGLHMVLLVPIDFISTYGLTILLLAGLVRARDKTVLWVAFGSLAVAIAFTGWVEVDVLRRAAEGTSPTELMFTDHYGQHLLLGLVMLPSKAILSMIGVVPGMLLGLWAARRRLLDEPDRHLGLLRAVAFGCLGFSLVARLPYTLIPTGHWDAQDGPMWWIAGLLHATGGYAGGIGAAALIGVIAVRLANQGPFTTAVAALGQRSMTFYLFQSAVFLVLFYPFTLDLADSMGIAATFAVGIGIWVVSLALAEWMRRAGHRGPFETLLRKLSERR